MLGGKKANTLKTLAVTSNSTEGKGNQSLALAAPCSAGRQFKKKSTDPNMTDGRLLVNRRCIYERQLPGDAYVTAHAERLQHGFFDSKNTSDPEIPHVDFLGVNFVMHPGDSSKHRFKAATIKATIQNIDMGDITENPYPYPQENPKFLMHAPHLIYGAVSPETLQWTFSLAGSLGISESPVSASLTPSGTRSASYKLYEMMKIQGSCRTLRSPDGPEFNVEDGEIVWSLSENSLQRSGLPREFTFVMLIQKPSANSRILFKLEIEPIIDVWYGSYPNWWLNRPSHQPLHKRAIDFRTEFGQRFTPVDSEKGMFNFADLANSLDDYVNMPGSTYSSNVSPDGVYNDPTGTGSSRSSQPSRPAGGTNQYIPEYPQYPTSEPTYYPPITNAGQIWQANSPFRQGWPRGDPYYYGSNGNSNNGENTLNVRILLDSNFTSQITAATLGAGIRHGSPLASIRHGSPLLKAPASTALRTRSLRRTRSSERLNRLSSSSADTEGLKDGTSRSTQPGDTTNKTPNGAPSSHEPASSTSTIYEINNTPPPDSIRDPTIVNGHRLKTSSEMLDDEEPLNGSHTPTPINKGTQSTRSVSGSSGVLRRSASQRQNGYQNRYSYPLPHADR